MFTVALVGHSLLPRQLGPVEGVSINIFRKPGATWFDINCPEYSEIWGRNFDLIIFVLGGNDLTVHSAAEVLDQAKLFIERALSCTNTVRVYTVETRHYQEDNRFRVSNEHFKSARNTYNRSLKRWLRSNGHLHVDFGKPWIVNERTSDGVHFNSVAMRNMKKSLIRVILGVKHSLQQ